MTALVGIIMGSSSDWETMSAAAETLAKLGIATRRAWSRRTARLTLFEYAAGAAARGLEVLIAGAGGAAHLPGMTAAKTLLPVLGVPVQSRALNGLDSLLSIVQMPAGRAGRHLCDRHAPGRPTPHCLPPRMLAPRYPRDRAGAERAPRGADRSGAGQHPIRARPSACSACRRRPRCLNASMKIGIVGAGQLGQMLALAGYPLGLEFLFLDRSAAHAGRPHRAGAGRRHRRSGAARASSLGAAMS